MSTIHERRDGGAGRRSTRAQSIQKLTSLRDINVVDLGAKEGYNTLDLADYGAKNVVGLEIRDRFIEEAQQERNNAGYKNVSFVKGDVQFVDELNLGHFDACLCSGLLYHMQNPFNVLKRIRNICDSLFLETHVSPPLFKFPFVGRKYRTYLTLRSYRVQLDGVEFKGRLNIFPLDQDMNATSGSIVSRVTFWLDETSLRKALRLAGFEIKAWYGAHASRELLQIPVSYGVRRTKVFVWAAVKDTRTPLPVQSSEITGNQLLNSG